MSVRKPCQFYRKTLTKTGKDVLSRTRKPSVPVWYASIFKVELVCLETSVKILTLCRPRGRRNPTKGRHVDSGNLGSVRGGHHVSIDIRSHPTMPLDSSHGESLVRRQTVRLWVLDQGNLSGDPRSIREINLLEWYVNC